MKARRLWPINRRDQAGAGVVLMDCPGSASRFPDWLVPIITMASPIGQAPAARAQIGTLCALGAAGMEPRTTCAHARRKRAPPPARASCARTYARVHTRTRTRIRARARFVLLSGRNLPAIRLFFYIYACSDDAGEKGMCFGGVN